LKHLEGILKGQRGLNLYYQGWLPAQAPCAVLAIVHGLAEHSGRYMNVVNHFVPLGYAVYGLDHRGHGKSSGLRGYVDSFSDYLNDLETFLGVVRRNHLNKPFFMLGHSIGATIATAYLCQHKGSGINGLIASGVNIKVGKSFSPLQAVLGRILSRLSPKTGVALIDASAISQDKAVVRAYVEDPLVYKGKIRARTGIEILKTMQKLPQQITCLELPILVLHGTADHLADPDGSRILYEGVASEDKTLKLYEGFYHEIFNEPGRRQVLSDIENWLKVHM
jgi:alpha-beta hydrolase superfamily lysophospholipase